MLSALLMLRALSEIARHVASKLQDIRDSLPEDEQLAHAKRIISYGGAQIADAIHASYLRSGKSPIDMRSFNKLSIADLQAKEPLAWIDLFIRSLRSHKLSSFELGPSERDAFVTNLVADPSLLEMLKGPDGYRFFSHYFFKGNMQYAYSTLSAALKVRNRSMDDLDWGGQFTGDTKRFGALRTEIGDWQKFTTSYRGPDGYVKFANDYFGGQMQPAYSALSALLKTSFLRADAESSVKPMDDLDWGGQFAGDTKRFGALRTEIGDWQKFTTSYRGPDGYVKFANDYFGGQMQPAYSALSALLKTTAPKFRLEDLGWGKIYSGDSATFSREILKA